MYFPLLIISVVLLAAAGAWIVIRGNPARRAERRARLHKRAAQFRSVLDSVPPRYLGTEVSQFLLNEVALCHADIIALDPASKEDEVALDDARKEIARLGESPILPDWSPKNEEEAVEVRRALSAAVRLVEHIQSTGGLTTARSRSLVQQLNNSIVRVRLESWMMQARTARAARDPQREVALWRRALEEFDHLPKNDESLVEVEKIHAYLDRAQEELKEKLQKANAESAAAAAAVAAAAALGASEAPQGSSGNERGGRVMGSSG